MRLLTLTACCAALASAAASTGADASPNAAPPGPPSCIVQDDGIQPECPNSRWTCDGAVEGVCACDPFYGWEGPECSRRSTRNYLIIGTSAFSTILFAAAAFDALSSVLPRAAKGTLSFRAKDRTMITATTALMVGTLWQCLWTVRGATGPGWKAWSVAADWPVCVVLSFFVVISLMQLCLLWIEVAVATRKLVKIKSVTRVKLFVQVSAGLSSTGLALGFANKPAVAVSLLFIVLVFGALYIVGAVQLVPLVSNNKPVHEVAADMVRQRRASLSRSVRRARDSFGSPTTGGAGAGASLRASSQVSVGAGPGTESQRIPDVSKMAMAILVCTCLVIGGFVLYISGSAIYYCGRFQTWVRPEWALVGNLMRNIGLVMPLFAVLQFVRSGRNARARRLLPATNTKVHQRPSVQPADHRRLSTTTTTTTTTCSVSSVTVLGSVGSEEGSGGRTAAGEFGGGKLASASASRKKVTPQKNSVAAFADDVDDGLPASASDDYAHVAVAVAPEAEGTAVVRRERELMTSPMSASVHGSESSSFLSVASSIVLSPDIAFPCPLSLDHPQQAAGDRRGRMITQESFADRESQGRHQLARRARDNERAGRAGVVFRMVSKSRPTSPPAADGPSSPPHRQRASTTVALAPDPQDRTRMEPQDLAALAARDWENLNRSEVQRANAANAAAAAGVARSKKNPAPARAASDPPPVR